MSRKGSNKSKRRDPTPHLSPCGPFPPSIPPKLKQRIVAAQARLMERAMMPIKVEFDISTVQGIMALNRQLVKLSFERVLGAHDVGAISKVVMNQLQILMPTELEMKIDEILQQTKDARKDLDTLKRGRTDQK